MVFYNNYRLIIPEKRMRRLFYFLRGLLSYCKLAGNLKNDFSRYSYNDLWNVSYFSKKLFLEIKAFVINKNKELLNKKETCRVCFVVHSVSMWTIDGLYHLMDSNPSYEPVIVIVPYASPNINKETYLFFKDKGYKTIVWDDPNFNLKSFDIIFYTHPYVADEDKINVLSISLDKLIVYVSYSYILSNKIEKIDMPVSLLSWKFICDSEYYKEILETKSRIYSDNAIFCGYPKMDAYYQSLKKHAKRETGKKVIIYAPHQSVNYSGVKSATFEMNGWFLLYLANKLKDKIHWIVKPHPLLRIHSVEAGLFADQNSYGDYLDEWEKSGAGDVVENGDYMDLFIDSDAMITDSVSFLAEYQFTGKPLLLLESGKQTYNDFGESIKEILYTCKGNDFAQIERFIESILEERDPMKDSRSSFFHSNLAYSTGTGSLACENLYELLNSEVRKLM